MRFNAKPETIIHWWFAWYPVRYKDKWIWLEWIKWQDHVMYWTILDDES